VIPEIVQYLKSSVTPGEAGSLFWMTVYVLAIFAGTALSTMVMVWMERKILAHMQVRLGPMRVGPHGLLQPVADSLKLLIKEDVIPRNADRLVFWFAPLMVVMTAFTMYITLPFGRTHAVTDINIGILFLLGVSSLGVLGVIMGGWSSNSHYPLLGALRSSAQMVSYEIPMGLAVVSAVVMTSLHTGTGTLSMIGIVEAQNAQHQWFAFTYFPLGLIAFVVFAISMVAETNRAPFDLPEAESELVAGFMTEYSGFRWSLFFLAEYASMIAISAIAVTLWLGGWLRPFPNALSGHTWDVAFSVVPAFLFTVIGGLCCVSVRRMPKIAELRAQRLGLAGFGATVLVIGLAMFLPGVRDRVQDIFWFVIKVAFFMYLYIWYRGTFPRYRFDQLMKVGWKVLLPIALGVLLLTATVGVWSEIWALAHEVMR
jgi:NADH-quinone oxidoreductase subunit H